MRSLRRPPKAPSPLPELRETRLWLLLKSNRQDPSACLPGPHGR
jgi:hypothetical protein